MSRNRTQKLNISYCNSTVSNGAPTVINAISKLKEESDMLLRQHRRYHVLNHQISKEHLRSVNRSKKASFFNSVQQSAEFDRNVKRQYERKKIEEVKKRFSVNLREREQNKQMLQNVKKTFLNANHQLYEQIRQKRKQNQEAIKSKRSFVMQSRAMTRKKAEEEEKNRRKSIQNFYNSKIESTRRNKEADVEEFLRKSQEKHQFCQVLSSRNSRIRENKLKDSRMSRSLSGGSARNPEHTSIEH